MYRTSKGNEVDMKLGLLSMSVIASKKPQMTFFFQLIVVMPPSLEKEIFEFFLFCIRKSLNSAN